MGSIFGEDGSDNRSPEHAALTPEDEGDGGFNPLMLLLGLLGDGGGGTGGGLGDVTGNKWADLFIQLGIPFAAEWLTKPSGSERAAYEEAIGLQNEQARMQIDIAKRLLGLADEIEGRDFSGASAEQITEMRGDPMNPGASFRAKSEFAAGKDIGFFQKIQQTQQALGQAANPGAVGQNAQIQIGLDQNRNASAGALANNWTNIFKNQGNSNWLQDLINQFALQQSGGGING